MKAAKRPQTVATLCVQPGLYGRFDVRDGLLVLGSSETEMMAIWSAVDLAQRMSESGCKARVVRLVAGAEVEEWPNPVVPNP